MGSVGRGRRFAGSAGHGRSSTLDTTARRQVPLGNWPPGSPGPLVGGLSVFTPWSGGVDLCVIGRAGGLRHRSARRDGHTAAPLLPLSRFLAAAAIPLLIIALFQAARLAWADTLFRRATTADMAQAARLCPDHSQYEFGLAQADPDRAAKHYRRALELNPYMTKARIALASEMEWRGNAKDSEAMLLEGERRDKQYAPAWALANFYFRQDRPEQFWHWARRAAAIVMET